MAENDLSKNRCDVNRVYIRITEEEVYSRLPEHQEPKRLEAHVEEAAAAAGAGARKAKAAALATGAAAAGVAAAAIPKKRRQRRRKAPKAARPAAVAAAVPPETTGGGGSGFLKWAALVVAGVVLASLAALFFTDISRFRDHEHDRAMAAASTNGLYLVGQDNAAAGRQIAQAGWEGVAVLGAADANGAAGANAQQGVIDLNQVNVTANAIAAAGKTPVVVYLFAFDSDKVSESPQLNAIANAAVASGKDVEVKAYTDPTGNVAYNQKLSAERADAISDYLVAHGVPANHIVVSALGPTHAFASDALDRRAEVTII